MLLSFRGIYEDSVVLDTDEIIAIKLIPSESNPVLRGIWSEVTMFNRDKFEIVGYPTDIKSKIERALEEEGEKSNITLDGDEVVSNLYYKNLGSEIDIGKISIPTMGSGQKKYYDTGKGIFESKNESSIQIGDLKFTNFTEFRPKSPETHEELLQKVVDEAKRLAMFKAPYVWHDNGDGYNDKTLLMKCFGEISKHFVYSHSYYYIAESLYHGKNVIFKNVELSDILPGDIIIYETPCKMSMFSTIYIGDSDVVDCSGFTSNFAEVKHIFHQKIKGAVRLDSKRFLTQKHRS